jgi:hypothetical protein
MAVPQAHLSVMKDLELTDDEAQALVRVIREAIDSDRFPLSPRIAVLRSILAQLRPEPARAPLPPLRNYVPPSKGRYRRRGGSIAPALFAAILLAATPLHQPTCR